MVMLFVEHVGRIGCLWAICRECGSAVPPICTECEPNQGDICGPEGLRLWATTGRQTIAWITNGKVPCCQIEELLRKSINSLFLLRFRKRLHHRRRFAPLLATLRQPVAKQREPVQLDAGQAGRGSLQTPAQSLPEQLGVSQELLPELSSSAVLASPLSFRHKGHCGSYAISYAPAPLRSTRPTSRWYGWASIRVNVLVPVRQGCRGFVSRSGIEPPTKSGGHLADHLVLNFCLTYNTITAKYCMGK